MYREVYLYCDEFVDAKIVSLKDMRNVLPWNYVTIERWLLLMLRLKIML